MAPLLSKQDSDAISKLFSARLLGGVTVLLFTKRECQHCPDALKLIEEVTSLDRRIRLQSVDMDTEPDRATKLLVELAPTAVIVATNGALLHYVGTPAGRQLASLVEDLIDASRGRPQFEKGTKETVAMVKQPTSIKVFVTPACQYSPLVVRSAHKFALANPLIKAYMVETLEFPEVAKRYGVVGVPRTVINEAFAFDGWPGEMSFAEKVVEMSART